MAAPRGEGGEEAGGAAVGCPVCGCALAGLAPAARERHVNACLDGGAGAGAGAGGPGPGPGPARAPPGGGEPGGAAAACPVCGRGLAGLPPAARERHVNECLDGGGGSGRAAAPPPARGPALGAWLEESGLGDLRRGPLGSSGLSPAAVALLDDAGLAALGLSAAQRKRVLAAACTVPLAGPALGASPAPRGAEPGGVALAGTRLREAGSPMRALWGYAGTDAGPAGGGGPWPTLEGHPEHCPRTSQRARGREESGRAWLQDQARVTAEEARVQWELAPELERIQREAQHGEGGAWGEG